MSAAKAKSKGSKQIPKKSTAKTKPANKKTKPRTNLKTNPAPKKRKTTIQAEPKARAAKPASKRKPAAAKTAKAKAPEKSKKLPPKRAFKSKMLSRSFLMDLCSAIKEAVYPMIESGKGKEVVGTAASGDATFELDVAAERALLNFLKAAHMPVAYYSEDSGYTTFTSSQPTNLLVVDPIDGTRSAKNGFEECAVCVCSTRVIERPTLADVDNACVFELVGNRAFYAEKGNGARIYIDGHSRKIRLSQNQDLESVAWAMSVPGRPAELIFPTAAKLIDLTSLKGGFFASNSTSYSLTRLLTGQLDAFIDFGNRYYRDIPRHVEDSFINAGRGVVIGTCPYDFAAPALIAQEAGCTITDAYGEDFDEVLLLDSSVSNHRSIIGAASAELHGQLLSFFDTRIAQFETLLKRKS